MKNIKSTALALLGAASPLLAFAQDSNYDYEWDYDYSSTTSDADAAAGLAIFGGLLIVWIIMAVVGLAFFIFWIVMLVDCVKRQFEQRNMWLAILIVSMFLGLSWIAAIVYYFAVKKKGLGTKDGGTPAAPTPPAQPQQ